MAVLLWAGPTVARAQSNQDDTGWGRRGGGLVLSTWSVGAPNAVGPVQPTYARSLMAEAYFRRGLSEHLALESSLSYWRRTSRRANTTSGTDTTRVYVLPLLTSLRVYPLTTVHTWIEPYLQGGAGLAISVQQDRASVAGGGGRNVAIGFGVKAALGVEIHAYGPIGFTLGGHYQGVRFGQMVDQQEAFGGTGVQGGVSYRFNL